MSQESVKEAERIVIHRDNSVSEISLETLNRVLWKYEENKEDYYSEQSKYRLGKVLTIIDGAIADETQRKAIKDMIHDAWYSDFSNRIGAPKYTHMHEVQTALGIDIQAQSVPSQVERYNPYKELVK